jgi:hypothetical protein
MLQVGKTTVSVRLFTDEPPRYEGQVWAEPDPQRIFLWQRAPDVLYFPTERHARLSPWADPSGAVACHARPVQARATRLSLPGRDPHYDGRRSRYGSGTPRNNRGLARLAPPRPCRAVAVRRAALPQLAQRRGCERGGRRCARPRTRPRLPRHHGPQHDRQPARAGRAGRSRPGPDPRGWRSPRSEAICTSWAFPIGWTSAR